MGLKRLEHYLNIAADERMLELSIDRRDFFKLSSVIVLSPEVIQISGASETIHFKEAVNENEKRQPYLESLVERLMPKIDGNPEAVSVIYKENPRDIFCRKNKELLPYKFSPSLKDRILTVCLPIPDIGKRKKRDLFFFPAAFKKDEVELELETHPILLKIMDFYEGIIINNVKYDSTKFQDNLILSMIINLRAYYQTMVYSNKKAFKNIKEDLRDYIDSKFFVAFRFLYGLYNSGSLSEYEEKVFLQQYYSMDKEIVKKTLDKYKKKERLFIPQGQKVMIAENQRMLIAYS